MWVAWSIMFWRGSISFGVGPKFYADLKLDVGPKAHV